MPGAPSLSPRVVAGDRVGNLQPSISRLCIRAWLKPCRTPVHAFVSGHGFSHAADRPPKTRASAPAAGNLSTAESTTPKRGQIPPSPYCHPERKGPRTLLSSGVVREGSAVAVQPYTGAETSARPTDRSQPGTMPGAPSLSPRVVAGDRVGNLQPSISRLCIRAWLKPCRTPVHAFVSGHGFSHAADRPQKTRASAPAAGNLSTAESTTPSQKRPNSTQPALSS